MHSQGMKQSKNYRNSVARLSTTLTMAEAAYTQGRLTRGGVGCSDGRWR